MFLQRLSWIEDDLIDYTSFLLGNQKEGKPQISHEVLSLPFRCLSVLRSQDCFVLLFDYQFLDTFGQHKKNVAQSKSMIRYYFPRTMTMTTSLEYTIDPLVDNENPIEGETKPRIESPDNLYKVDLKIADSLRPKVNRDPSKVCAGAFGKGPCQGDSRGPLVAELSPRRYVLIGFVSYDSRCGDENATIFTRVSQFLSWTNIFINLTWPQLPKTTERFSEFRPPTV